MSSLFPSTRGGGLTFSLFGIPVTVSLSVVLLLGFLGFQLGDPLLIALWVAIGIGSILLHELGHAVVARAAGAEPTIQLAGLGGATSYTSSARTRSRGWSLAIGLAGPAVGIVLGGGAVALGAPCCQVVVGGPVSEFAVSVFVFVSLVWSVLNLLPVLPLDGGQALASLLPGSPAQRQVRAAIVGTVIGGGIALVALATGYPFGAILLALLTWQNIQIWRAGSARGADAAEFALDRQQLQVARDALARGDGDGGTAARIQQAAFRAGEFQVAAEVGEVALARGFEHPAYAYVAACAWAQLGALDRAVEQLRRAIDLGFDEPQRLVDEPALRPLHDHPAWAELTRG